MIEFYKNLLESKENMTSSFGWISEEQFEYIKQNFQDLECNLNTFISYSTKDKKIAAMIKDALSNLGISSFLAHEDISPSKEWQTEIVNELKSCNIFVPLITDNFKQSEWTDQESGAAFIKGADIIPLSVSLDGKLFITPYGFLSKYQALKYTIDPTVLNDFPLRITRELQSKLVDALKTKSNIVEMVRNCYVNSIVNSKSFADSNNKYQSLDQLKPFNRTQMRMLVFGYVLNNQLKSTYKAGPHLRTFIESNVTDLDEISKSIFENGKND